MDQENCSSAAALPRVTGSPMRSRRRRAGAKKKRSHLATSAKPQVPLHHLAAKRAPSGGAMGASARKRANFTGGHGSALAASPAGVRMALGGNGSSGPSLRAESPRLASPVAVSPCRKEVFSAISAVPNAVASPAGIASKSGIAEEKWEAFAGEDSALLDKVLEMALGDIEGVPQSPYARRASPSPRRSAIMIERMDYDELADGIRIAAHDVDAVADACLCYADQLVVEREIALLTDGCPFPSSPSSPSPSSSTTSSKQSWRMWARAKISSLFIKSH